MTDSGVGGDCVLTPLHPDRSLCCSASFCWLNQTHVHLLPCAGSARQRRPARSTGSLRNHRKCPFDSDFCVCVELTDEEELKVSLIGVEVSPAVRSSKIYMKPIELLIVC